MSKYNFGTYIRISRDEKISVILKYERELIK